MQNKTAPFGPMILPLFLLTSIFFSNFVARIIPAPLMPTILTDLNLTEDQAGSFFLTISAGYFISILCSGFVSARLKHKKTLLISAIGTGIFLMGVGVSKGLVSILFCLFLLGLSTGLYLPSGMAILTASIDKSNWGKALGIHELAPNMSFLLAPLLCELFLLWWSWRSVFFVIGMLSLFFGLLFFKFSTAKDFRGEAPTLSAVIPMARTRSFWLMVLLFAVGVSGTMGIYSMMPLYLVKEHGMLQADANALVSLSRALAIPIALTAGWMADRIGLKRALTGQLFVNGCMTLLIGCVSGKAMLGVILLQPMVAQAFFPAGFAALSRVGSAKTRNISISFTLPISFLVGGGLMPKTMGILGNSGHFSAGFILCGVLLLACVLVPSILKFSE